MYQVEKCYSTLVKSGLDDALFDSLTMDGHFPYLSCQCGSVCGKKMLDNIDEKINKEGMRVCNRAKFVVASNG